jgi:DNA-directed RNA polymerase specialized sigma24 family protein
VLIPAGGTARHMEERDYSRLVAGASAREEASARELVAALHPMLRARVARLVWRARGGGGRDLRQEVQDMTQEVFAFLFQDGAKALLSWKADGGMSFLNYVGLISERRVLTVMRQDQEPPATHPLDGDGLDRQPDPAIGPEPATFSRELLTILLDRMRESLSPLGYQLFELIYVQELSVDEIASACQLSDDAVYAWRSRLRKVVARLASELLADDTTGPKPTLPRSQRRE